MLVKTEGNLGSFDRETSIYDFKSVRDSPYIRELREVVDNGTDRCMIFEWMDTNLWGVHRQKRELGSSFVKLTAKSALEALRVLGDLDGQAAVHNGMSFLLPLCLVLCFGFNIWEDINVKTIMVGGLRTQSPSIKLSNFERGTSQLLSFLDASILVVAKSRRLCLLLQSDFSDNDWRPQVKRPGDPRPRNMEGSVTNTC